MRCNLIAHLFSYSNRLSFLSSHSYSLGQLLVQLYSKEQLQMPKLYYNSISYILTHFVTPLNPLQATPFTLTSPPPPLCKTFPSSSFLLLRCYCCCCKNTLLSKQTGKGESDRKQPAEIPISPRSTCFSWWFCLVLSVIFWPFFSYELTTYLTRTTGQPVHHLL